MWENLNLSSSGHGYTLFKIVGIAVVLVILGLAYKAYKARTGGSSVSKKTRQRNRGLGSTSPPSASSSSTVSPKGIEKKQLPNGIKEENIKACLDFIKNNPYKQSGTFGGDDLIGFDATIPKDQVTEFTKGVDGWNAHTFFDHLVKEEYIKKYHICERNSQTYVWM